MEQLVVKDNRLIQASYSLGLVEQRLMLLAIVGARETGDGITAESLLTVRAEDYAKHFNVERQAAYMALSDAVETLFNRRATIDIYDKRKDKMRPMVVRWVTAMQYEENEACVTLRFGHEVVPLITKLEEQFTSYELKQIAGLSSAYAIRLYELLMQWKITGKTPIFDLYMFRNQLGILDSEYQRMFDFKRYVLDLAIKQINEHTDIAVKYEQHKQGRSIAGFSFIFKQGKKSLKVLEEKSKPVKKPAEPLRNAWNTPENSLFKTLYAKCPTLTKEYVENLAKTQNKSIHDLLNIMFMEYAKVDSFELQPSS
jgi:plasmid replication initiation protein